jgi:hypothetical protein
MHTMHISNCHGIDDLFILKLAQCSPQLEEIYMYSYEGSETKTDLSVLALAMLCKNLRILGIGNALEDSILENTRAFVNSRCPSIVWT